MDLPMAELIKLAKMAGHAWGRSRLLYPEHLGLHRLATDVLSIACVIYSPCTLAFYLDLSNFIL